MSLMQFKDFEDNFKNSATWKNVIAPHQKLLLRGNTEIVAGLIDILKKFIHGQTYLPMQRLGALVMLKSCLQAGSSSFNTQIQVGNILDNLVAYTRVVPTLHIFSNKPTHEEKSVAKTFLTCIVEGFLFWSQWFPNSKFSTIYANLVAHGTKFPLPAEALLFSTRVQDAYVNGQFTRNKQILSELKSSISQSVQLRSNVQFGSKVALSLTDIQNRVIEYDSMHAILIDMILQTDDARRIDIAFISDYYNSFRTLSEELFTVNQKNFDQNMRITLTDKQESFTKLNTLITDYFNQTITFSDLQNEIREIGFITNSNMMRFQYFQYQYDDLDNDCFDIAQIYIAFQDNLNNKEDDDDMNDDIVDQDDEHSQQIPLGRNKKSLEQLNQNTDKLCSICLDSQNTHTLIPCGHKKFCETCAQNMLLQEMCPICLTPATHVFRIYE